MFLAVANLSPVDERYWAGLLHTRRSAHSWHRGLSPTSEAELDNHFQISVPKLKAILFVYQKRAIAATPAKAIAGVTPWPTSRGGGPDPLLAGSRRKSLKPLWELGRRKRSLIAGLTFMKSRWTTTPRR